ncbi:MAG: hypothetical protein U1F65_03120 [Verrucomicrobiota bacterium]
MKNAIIGILLIATLALGALFLTQQKQAKTKSEQLAATESKLAEAKAEVQSKSEADEKVTAAETKARILQDTLKETAASVEQQSNRVAQLQAAAKTNTPANPFAAMLKDPKMKEMIKTQQKMVMGPMIEKNYSAFLKQSSLSPEQAANLKQLLTDKMLSGADMGMSMLDGSLDAEKRAELTRQVKTNMDNYDRQIKELLGDDTNKAFQDYEKTVPDRMAISQLHDQLANTPNALTPELENQIIGIMSQERTGFKWTTDYSNQNAVNGDLGKMFTEDKLNTFALEKEQLDQKVLDRVKPLLSEDQFTAYQSFLEQQRNLQLAGMKMAGQMFGR